jgi:hypothetical protein
MKMGRFMMSPMYRRSGTINLCQQRLHRRRRNGIKTFIFRICFKIEWTGRNNIE